MKLISPVDSPAKAIKELEDHSGEARREIVFG